MGKYIIIINGIGGVGKDTLCDFAAKHYHVKNVSSITPVKEIARMAGWNGEKDAAARKLLSDLKRILIEYNDFPTNYLLKECGDFQNSNDDLMFIHIREPEEIQKLKERVTNCPCITLLVRREALKTTHWGNASDDNVLHYSYDYIYDNVKELQEAEADFVSFLEHITGIPAF